MWRFAWARGVCECVGRAERARGGGGDVAPTALSPHILLPTSHDTNRNIHSPLSTIHHHHVQVYLNGEKLPVKAFADYCDLYLGPKDATGVPRVYERVNDR